MKLSEEFKIYENMWEPLQEANRSGMSSPEEYFNDITSSVAAISAFVKDQLIPYTNNRQRFDPSSSYSSILAKNTTSGSNVDILRNSSVNYKAFLAKISTFGITRADLLNFIKTGNLKITGTPVVDATSASIPEEDFDWLKAPEVPQDMKDAFHIQNIRILRLLVKYTDIHSSHKINLNDLLKQLDENRLKNPYQAERDFAGI